MRDPVFEGTARTLPAASTVQAARSAASSQYAGVGKPSGYVRSAVAAVTVSPPSAFLAVAKTEAVSETE